MTVQNLHVSTVKKRKNIAVIAAFCLCAIGMVRNDLVGLSLVPADQSRRKAWRYFGPDSCTWEAPQNTPGDNFEKLLVVGFPSGGKRVTFAQMEGLTGLKAKDSWDFFHKGITNEPFIISNYPHQEGKWGWRDEADKVVLTIRNIRSAMIEYHAIKYDLGYSTTYEETQMHIDNLFQNYQDPQSIADFEYFRNVRVLGEIKRYGWVIDYWMEGGLLRDSTTNELTTQTHWDMLRDPNHYSSQEIIDQFTADRSNGIDATYDPNCVGSNIAHGCEPLDVLCADSVLDVEMGPVQIHKIGAILKDLRGVSNYVINQDAWECIWEEIVVNRKGSMMDREEYSEDDYEFSVELLTAMAEELDRLISKYSVGTWVGKTNAESLVEILGMHRVDLQEKIDSL